MNVRKTITELATKLTSCVIQNQFSENIRKISEVFEKYSSKILEIDRFIGQVKAAS